MSGWRWRIHNADDPDDLTMIFIHIPVPFEKGDLVEYEGKPGIIISDLPHADVKFYERGLAGSLDGRDMVALTYFGVDYFIDHEHPLYHELKYFTGELKGKDRFLKYLSRYIKEKDDNILQLLAVFRILEAEAESERINERFRGLKILDEEDERKSDGNRL